MLFKLKCVTALIKDFVWLINRSGGVCITNRSGGVCITNRSGGVCITQPWSVGIQSPNDVKASSCWFVVAVFVSVHCGGRREGGWSQGGRGD